MTVVTTPAFAETVEELMILVDVAIPLTVEVRVFTADTKSLPFTKDAVVVAICPFTVEVSTKELVEVEIVRVCEVDDATRLVRSVEVATPLMVVVSTAPLVERALEVIIEEVAVTPLMVEVSVLPDETWVKELMIVASDEDTPFTIVWKRLADEDAVLEVMIEEVPVDPPRLLVRVLPEDERVFEVVRLVMVAFTAVRLVKKPVTEEMSVEKKVDEVALVLKSVSAVRAVADAVESVV
jgi:hypothetical protein